MGTKHVHIHKEYHSIIEGGKKEINSIKDRINSQNERINDVNGKVDKVNEDLFDYKRNQNKINDELKYKIGDIENISKNNEKDLKKQKQELEKNIRKLNEFEELIQIQNNNMNDLQDQQIIMENQIKKNNLENQKKYDEHDK